MNKNDIVYVTFENLLIMNNPGRAPIMLRSIMILAIIQEQKTF